MKSFFKMFLACWTAFAVMWVMGWVITFSLLGSYVADLGEYRSVRVKSGSILELDLSGGLQEHSARALPDVLREVLGTEVGLSVPDVLDIVRRASADPNIKGISLKIGNMGGALAQLEEIRQALLAFKAKGKFIYGYATYLGQGEYYLGAVSDVFMLKPIGHLRFNGLVAKRMYLKRALDKLKIQPVVFRVGAYKSAVEPLTRSSMSPESREQITELMESVYGSYLENVGNMRNTSPEQLREWADEYGIWTPDRAKDKNLITHIGYYDEYKALLRAKLNLSEKEKIPLVKGQEYAESGYQKRDAKNKIAVLVAQGTIQDGDDSSMEDGVFADSFVRRIQKLKADSAVQAVVLRIHSPGGSFSASDKIWKALKALANEKPLVASMAGVAASGGYYIALPCHKLFAQKTTITGSIGVFGLFFNIGEGARHIGIDFDKAQTGPMADLINTTEPLSPAVREVLSREIDRMYAAFLDRVASARSQSVEDIHQVAQGRVWSGIHAKERNLIDEYGGLYDATQWAAKQAEIPNNDYVLYYDTDIAWDKIVRQIIFSSVSLDFLGVLKTMAEPYQELQALRGIQARCLDTIQF